MLSLLDSIDGAVTAAAHGTTRRRFLSRASQGALALTFGAAFLGRNPELAQAGLGCSGTRCPSNHCYASGYCHNTDASRRRQYNDQYCLGESGGTACWTNGSYRCCDCCVSSNTGGSTCIYITCGATRYMCTCVGTV